MSGAGAGTWVVRYDSDTGPRYYVGAHGAGIEYAPSQREAKRFASLAKARAVIPRLGTAKVYRLKPRPPRVDALPLARAFEDKFAKAADGHLHGKRIGNDYMVAQCKGERDTWAEAARMVREAATAPTKKGT